MTRFNGVPEPTRLHLQHHKDNLIIVVFLGDYGVDCHAVLVLDALHDIGALGIVVAWAVRRGALDQIACVEQWLATGTITGVAIRQGLGQIQQYGDLWCWPYVTAWKTLLIPVWIVNSWCLASLEWLLTRARQWKNRKWSRLISAIVTSSLKAGPYMIQNLSLKWKHAL